VLFIAVAVGAFAVILPRVADTSHVWRLIRALGVMQIALLVAATAWNVLTYWPVMMAGLPGLPIKQAAVVNQSSTSVAMTVPGGGALAVGVTYGMLSSWGFRRTDIALMVLVTGIWSTFAKLALPAVALPLLFVTGDQSTGMAAGALVGGAVLLGATIILVASVWSERLAGAIGSVLSVAVSAFRRILRRPPVTPWTAMAIRFRARLLALLRRRWAVLTVATLISHLSVFLVFLLAVRFVGIPESGVSWTQTLAVFALVRLGSAVPIIPGNVGLAELGYVAGLVLAGGDRPHSVAAVLVFRALTYYAQVPIGGATYVVWRRRVGWRHRPDQHHPEADAGQPGDGHGDDGGAAEPEDGPRGQQEQAPVPAS
jgi:uncharacterized membrane protein YbhN (UPF0104 family)